MHEKSQIEKDRERKKDRHTDRLRTKMDQDRLGQNQRQKVTETDDRDRLTQRDKETHRRRTKDQYEGDRWRHKDKKTQI